MNKPKLKFGNAKKVFPLCLLSLAIHNQVLAQTEQDTNSEEQESGTEIKIDAGINISSPIEEVLTLGRLQSSAHDLVFERMESENVVDFVSATQMARIGDSTVAAALKRVPGLTLINGKFVYVRGLGERYSSVTLNGASVPSPDLTRSVIPLDIFPASVVDSIAIQKTYSSDMPSAFGGGNINVRTKGIPDGPVLSFELSGGMNSDSGDVFTYSGGGDDNLGEDDGTRALSADIYSGLRTYRPSSDGAGDISPDAIEATYARAGVPVTAEFAEAENARLASTVYRDLDINEESESLNDYGMSFAIGNAYELSGLWEAGFLADVSYDRSTRADTRIRRNYRDPEDEFDSESRTTQNVSLTGAFNAGLRWGDDHIVESKNLLLRNTDDEVGITNRYTQTAPFSSGQGQREYDYKFEQRELEIYQIEGSHRLGYDTREKFGLSDSIFDDMTIDWFYSDSTVNTDIPSEISVQGFITRDVESNQIVSSRLARGQRMFDVRYTELVDNAESSGVEATLPFTFGETEVEVSGGVKNDRKSRSYEQLDMSIGTTSSAVDSTLGGSISEAFSDENILNPDNDYRLILQPGLSRSYLAANTTDAFFGELDVFWREKIRVALGARYEEFAQFSAPWQPLRNNGSRIRIGDVGPGITEAPEGVFYDDDIYGSLALTYVMPGFIAEDFQIRFGVSETTVRPDLREISDSSYLHPLDDRLLIEGNPNLIPSDITNVDFRAEWLFSNSDSLSIALFYKDVVNPIEFFESAGAEESRTAKIENAESGKIQGVELEWMKNMGFLGSTASQFYVQGNVTLSESEIVAGDNITVAATNRTRPMQGASEYVVNLQLGFDSDDGRHAATMAYNVFGERVFAGGISEEPDAYEQPFNAVDFLYSYYPTDNFTVKLKLQNVLDENVEISKGDVTLYERTVGASYGLSFKYSY